MRTLSVLCATLALVGAALPALAQSPTLEVERAPDGEPVIVHEGKASFYGDQFHGRKTATGEIFDQNKPTAASKELPLGTTATVTNEETGKSTEVIVNDRGPYVQGRVIDLSKKAAEEIGLEKDQGLAPVRVEAKPSEQPNEEAKQKVEEKAEKVSAGSTGKAESGSGSGK